MLVRFRSAAAALAITLLTASFPAEAGDEPFGADTLGYLTRGAELVVRITGPKSLPTMRNERYSLYSVKGVGLLKGTLDLDRDVTIAVPIYDVEQPGDAVPADAVAFLRKFDPEEDEPGNLPKDRDVYVVVAGTKGIVDAAVPGRLEGIGEFVKIDANGEAAAPVVNWAVKHAASEDPLLQRSAVVALYERADASEAREAIKKALAMGGVSAENMLLLVEALGQTGDADAVPPLKAVVEDARLPIPLREAAARWFRTLPGGPDQLEQWRQSADEDLASLAESVLSGG